MDNSKYLQSIDAGWNPPVSCKDIDGSTLYHDYGTDMTKSEYLASDLGKLPELMVMNDGRPVTAELWAERRKEIMDIIMSYTWVISNALHFLNSVLKTAVA